MNTKMQIQVDGICKIIDATPGEEPFVVMEQHNAIHPQNMARVISRALSNEDNYYIWRIAFGNGGTVVDAAYNITYKTPNVGLPPTDTSGWRSQLYNEVYWEIIDNSSTLISTGPGSVPQSDPPATAHSPNGPGVTSNDLGLLSSAVVRCWLNQNEPTSQFINDTIGNPLTPSTENTDTAFVFDEIALFTNGAPLNSTSGYQFIDIGNRNISDLTSLSQNTIYIFDITVDGVAHSVSITTPTQGSGAGGVILYSDLLGLLNSALSQWCSVSLNAGTDVPTNPSAVINDSALTYGYLKFTSNTTGSSSSILIIDAGAGANPPNWLFGALNSYLGLLPPIPGNNAGVQNDVMNPSNEAERLLTHLIFSPIKKTANRTFIIEYTLTVSIAPTIETPATATP